MCEKKESNAHTHTHTHAHKHVVAYAHTHGEKLEPQVRQNSSRSRGAEKPGKDYDEASTQVSFVSLWIPLNFIPLTSLELGYQPS